MAIPLKALKVGHVYAQGDAAKQIYCYMGKVRGRYDKYSSEVKEGHCFLYVGREYMYSGRFPQVWNSKRLAEGCVMMLTFHLGDRFSITKQNKPMQFEFSPNVFLTDADVLMLLNKHGLVRI